MGDIKINEAFADLVYVYVTSTGLPATGEVASLTCVFIKPDDTRNAVAEAEVGNGWYRGTHSPNTGGVWGIEWKHALADRTIVGAAKVLKVGGGQIDDIDTNIDQSLSTTESNIRGADADDLKSVSDEVATRAPASEYDTEHAAIANDIEEAHERAFTHVYPYDAESQSVSSASDASLTSPGTNTITFPTGATLLRARVIAHIKATAMDDSGHTIGLTLQKNVAGGGWVDIIVLATNPHLNLPAIALMSDSVTIVESVVVTTGQSLDFRWQVDSDDAGEVHYLSDFVYSAEYDFQ